MRKLIVSEFLSLDGVMEAPENWHFPYQNDEMQEIIESQIKEVDVMLFGRVTYEIFAGFWPTQAGGESPIADKLNSTGKYVVSSKLKKAGWNNTTVIKGDLAEQVRELKRGQGGDIGINGSAALVQSLVKAGLVDEFQFLLHPVLVGTGKRLFKDGSDLKGLKLVDSRALATGVLLLKYQLDGKTAHQVGMD